MDALDWLDEIVEKIEDILHTGQKSAEEVIDHFIDKLDSVIVGHGETGGWVHGWLGSFAQSLGHELALSLKNVLEKSTFMVAVDGDLRMTEV